MIALSIYVQQYIRVDILYTHPKAHMKYLPNIIMEGKLAQMCEQYLFVFKEQIFYFPFQTYKILISKLWYFSLLRPRKIIAKKTNYLTINKCVGTKCIDIFINQQIECWQWDVTLRYNKKCSLIQNQTLFTYFLR